jgi:hypothetical protein
VAIHTKLPSRERHSSPAGDFDVPPALSGGAADASEAYFFFSVTLRFAEL